MPNPRTTKEEIESGLSFMPKFDQDGLIPAVVQDHQTHQILMVAYMNQEALTQTLKIQEAVFYSRSRQELWHKGATSGNTQIIKEILVDCDQDCLILKVEQVGGAACHTGKASCFYRTVNPDSTLTDTGGEQLFDPQKVYGK